MRTRHRNSAGRVSGTHTRLKPLGDSSERSLRQASGRRAARNVLTMKPSAMANIRHRPRPAIAEDARIILCTGCRRRTRGRDVVPSISVLLATPDKGLFERMRMLLLARPEVRYIPRFVEDGDVLAAVHRKPPDVLLVDGAGFGYRAIRLIQRVAALDLATRSLLLHREASEFRLSHVLQCGGAGCLPIASSAYELIQAIVVVHSGELWASRKALADVLRQLQVPTTAPCPVGSEAMLSKREREIVEWMREGMTNKEIARKLGISDMTVKTHAQNIFHKLEVSGRRRLFGLGNQTGHAAIAFTEEPAAASRVPIEPGDPGLKPAA